MYSVVPTKITIRVLHKYFYSTKQKFKVYFLSGNWGLNYTHFIFSDVKSKQKYILHSLTCAELLFSRPVLLSSLCNPPYMQITLFAHKLTMYTCSAHRPAQPRYQMCTTMGNLSFNADPPKTDSKIKLPQGTMGATTCKKKR